MTITPTDTRRFLPVTRTVAVTVTSPPMLVWERVSLTDIDGYDHIRFPAEITASMLDAALRYHIPGTGTAAGVGAGATAAAVVLGLLEGSSEICYDPPVGAILDAGSRELTAMLKPTSPLGSLMLAGVIIEGMKSSSAGAVKRWFYQAYSYVPCPLTRTKINSITRPAREQVHNGTGMDSSSGGVPGCKAEQHVPLHC